MGDAVTVNTLEFAGARAQEIANMEEVMLMGNRDRSKRIFQRLPRHMRRRQMSHNVKRLPRNMREIARHEMQSQGLTKTDGAPKRPSRFYRRRPRRLEEEYAKRQKRVRWLETHIWHAKRFHMIEKWGYRLPDRPTDKGVRAAYRYASRYASVTDLSYYQHLEIKGESKDIAKLFEAFHKPEVGANIGAGRYASGAMRGRAILYEPVSSETTTAPTRVLCDAEFLWRPPSSISDPSRLLWLWVHPVSINRLVSALNDAVDRLELSCGIADISGQITRFRLFGPKSTIVLCAALRPSFGEGCSSTSTLHEKLASRKISKIDEKFSTWLKDDIEFSSSSKRLHSDRLEKWKFLRTKIGSPHELPRDWVTAIDVEDPRLSRPAKKTIYRAPIDDGNPTMDNDDPSSNFLTYDARCAESALWKPEVRRLVKDKRLTIADIYILRNANLVPGTPLELGKYTAHLPVILCQHPGGRQRLSGGGGNYNNNGSPDCWAAGIDVLLPAGWGKDVWLSLIYSGARAGGLQEVAAADFENALLTFPRYFPDAADGAEEEKKRESEAMDKYFARPLAKRVNFLSLGIHFPFRSPWNQLVGDWENDISKKPSKLQNETFFVIRERSVLNRVIELVSAPMNYATISIGLEELLRNSLVPIRVSCESKGTIAAFSTICLPTEEDIDEFRRRSLKGETWTPPEEPPHWVSDERFEHLKKAVKKTGREWGVARFPISVDRPEDVRHVASRETMGFVVDGRLALTRGKPRGVGFVAGKSLLSVVASFSRLAVKENNNNNKRKYFGSKVELDRPFLLSRCPNSTQYRRVDFEILC